MPINCIVVILGENPRLEYDCRQLITITIRKIAASDYNKISFVYNRYSHTRSARARRAAGGIDEASFQAAKRIEIARALQGELEPLCTNSCLKLNCSRLHEPLLRHTGTETQTAACIEGSTDFCLVRFVDYSNRCTYVPFPIQT